MNNHEMRTFERFPLSTILCNKSCSQHWQYYYCSTMTIIIVDNKKQHCPVVAGAGGQLKSEKPTLHRCQALLDFCSWTQPKTGDLIGSWLEECHRAVGCRPNYITSHIVDGAAMQANQCSLFNGIHPMSGLRRLLLMDVMLIKSTLLQAWHREQVSTPTT